jgi:hypothetical protein
MWIDTQKWKASFKVDELYETFEYKEREAVLALYPRCVSTSSSPSPSGEHTDEERVKQVLPQDGQGRPTPLHRATRQTRLDRALQSYDPGTTDAISRRRVREVPTGTPPHLLRVDRPRDRDELHDYGLEGRRIEHVLQGQELCAGGFAE